MTFNYPNYVPNYGNLTEKNYEGIYFKLLS